MLDVVAVIFSVVALMIAFGWKIELGSLAEWLGGFGTVAAVSVALWIAGDEGRRHDEDAKRQQAESVAAWGSGFIRAETGRPGAAMLIVVSNGSKVPIYDVAVELVYEPLAGEQGTSETHRTFVELIPPGEWKFQSQRRIPYRKLMKRVAVPVAFTDARGNHWKRDIDGGPVRQVDSSAFDEHGPRENIGTARPTRVDNDAE